jgi:hypothetical protein
LKPLLHIGPIPAAQKAKEIPKKRAWGSNGFNCDQLRRSPMA